jgi:hypothetical protein
VEINKCFVLGPVTVPLVVASLSNSISCDYTKNTILIAIMTNRNKLTPKNLLGSVSFRLMLACIGVYLIGPIIGGLDKLIRSNSKIDPRVAGMFADLGPDALRPEPIERAVFLLCLLLIPPILLLALPNKQKYSLRQLWGSSSKDLIFSVITSVMLLLPI